MYWGLKIKDILSTHKKNPVQYLHKYVCTPTQVFVLDFR